MFEVWMMKISVIVHSLIFSSCVGCLIADLIDDVLEAVGSNDVDEVKSIIAENKDDLGSFINLRDSVSGETPLLRSILAGHADLVRLLLALPEVDLGVGTADGYTALHVAAWRGRPEITRMLLEDGRLDVNDFHRKHYFTISSCKIEEKLFIFTNI